MAENTGFAHGFHYGDYSGVVFYGPPANGFWLDRLAVSDVYINPLFRAIMDRSWRESDGESLPRIVSEWNTLTGWADIGAGIVAIPPSDALQLVAALQTVSESDLVPHVAGTSVAECLQCSATIESFLRARLDGQQGVYIEDD